MKTDFSNLNESSDDDRTDGPRSRKGPGRKKGVERVKKRLVRLTPTKLRIVAGELGGRRIQYNGDPDTRPMKEKTREAVFSLLGGYLDGYFAIDLFAGTGVLGFEAISRGALGALMLELSRPTVNTLLANMRLLGLDSKVAVQNVDTLRWLKNAEQRTMELPQCPWVIFCCPPYSLWREQTKRLIEGLESLKTCAPQNSIFVCETDAKFDLAVELREWGWDIRYYQPARIALCVQP